MSTYLFADETKARGYVLAGSVHASGDLSALRAVVRGLVLPGQQRIHMTKERDVRKAVIADALIAAGVRATIYDAHTHRRDVDARQACLTALAVDACRHPDPVLVLEQDDSVLQHDRRHLYQVTRTVAPGLRYQHARAASEELLAIPDAIAWCWAKGGRWRARIQPTIVDLREV